MTEITPTGDARTFALGAPFRSENPIATANEAAMSKSSLHERPRCGQCRRGQFMTKRRYPFFAIAVGDHLAQD